MASLQVPAAEAKLLLAPHLASCKQLVVAAALVGDQDDFGVWSWRCKDWRTGLGGVLKYIYGTEAARTFEQATRAAGQQGVDWRTAVGEEVAGLQSTLGMLEDLSTELGDAGAGPTPGGPEPADLEVTPSARGARELR